MNFAVKGFVFPDFYLNYSAFTSPCMVQSLWWLCAGIEMILAQANSHLDLSKEFGVFVIKCLSHLL